MDVDELRAAVGRDAVLHMDAVDETVIEMVTEVQEAAVALMHALTDRDITRADAIGIVVHTSIIAMLSPE